MKIWTTFCPKKVCWELTYAQTAGKKPTSNWQQHKQLISESLMTLKSYGIAGIRLVILPEELTRDGKKWNWGPIDTMLTMCHNLKLSVVLCVGPFQYPYYPGIYFPKELLKHIHDNDNALDTNPRLFEFGMTFLTLQMQQYADDKRVYGFHFANEWPDRQVVSGKEPLKKTVSEDFMNRAGFLLKELTEKPIFLNTNIDAANKQKLTKTFTNLITILGEQAKLGFDVYPSQESWIRTPLQKLQRIFESYTRSINWSQKNFAPCEIFFAEVEAQPWGNGQAWYRLIQQAENPDEEVLTYSKDSLKKTWQRHLSTTKCDIISLWGSDFWLVAYQMGITWPLEQVKEIYTSK